MPERMYRVEISGLAKKYLMRHGATTDADYEEIGPDKFVIRVDAQVYSWIESRRSPSQTWGACLEETLKYGQLTPF